MSDALSAEQEEHLKREAQRAVTDSLRDLRRWAVLAHRTPEERVVLERELGAIVRMIEARNDR